MRFNKQSRQKMFAIWAKKEHRNLLRLHRAGIPCPEPIKQREHTLVLSFIGKDHWPAPQLREIDLSKANWRRLVEKNTTKNMKKRIVAVACTWRWGVLNMEKEIVAVSSAGSGALKMERRIVAVTSSTRSGYTAVLFFGAINPNTLVLTGRGNIIILLRGSFLEVKPPVEQGKEEYEQLLLLR